MVSFFPHRLALFALLYAGRTSHAHTCGYLRAAYHTAGLVNGTKCCGMADDALVVAPEVQRVLFAFPAAVAPALRLDFADHAVHDGARFLVTILRRPGSVEQHLSRVGAFVLAQDVEQAYVPEEPQVLSFDDWDEHDRHRLEHAVGGLPIAFFPTSRLAFG
jgi:hypothetical protein